MNEQEARIKLAEAMGYEWRPKPQSWRLKSQYPEMGDWFDSTGNRLTEMNPCGCKVPPDGFDPSTDANDCDALIDFLSSQGWHYEESRQATNDPDMDAGVWLHIWNVDEVHHRWDGSVSLRKQGVCELALKVIDDD